MNGQGQNSSFSASTKITIGIVACLVISMACVIGFFVGRVQGTKAGQPPIKESVTGSSAPAPNNQSSSAQNKPSTTRQEIAKPSSNDELDLEALARTLRLSTNQLQNDQMMKIFIMQLGIVRKGYKSAEKNGMIITNRSSEEEVLRNMRNRANQIRR